MDLADTSWIIVIFVAEISRAVSHHIIFWLKKLLFNKDKEKKLVINTRIRTIYEYSVKTNWHKTTGKSLMKIGANSPKLFAKSFGTF